MYAVEIEVKRDYRRSLNNWNTHFNIVQMQRASTFVHVFFQVFIQVFEYKSKRFFSMNDIMEGNCENWKQKN